MLNELFELDASRKAAGIMLESWHPDYGSCPKGPTYYLLIGSDSDVVDLEPIRDVEKRKANRKWEIANGTSFPAFNVLPLLHASSQAGKDAVTSLKELLKSHAAPAQITEKLQELWMKCDLLWIDTEVQRISRCLKDHAAVLSSKVGPPPPDLAALVAIIGRAAKLQASALMDGLKATILRKLIQNPEEAKEWIETLLVNTSPTRRAVDTKKVSLVLEVADRSQFPYPANHAKVQAWINSRLMAGMVPVPMGKAAAIDAFGCAGQGADATFPDVNLTKLGAVRLRAMSSESPCQYRYGAADFNSFPVGSELRQSMKDSLEWLGHPLRKRKTWQDVSEACGYSKGLLFAYPSLLDPDPPELAGFFCASDDSSQRDDSAKFEAAAASVTTALNGILERDPQAHVRIFILVKPDGFRTKVLVSRDYRASHLVDAAKEWQAGCNNIPKIGLNIGTRDKVQWINPLRPFPNEVIRCLNTAWFRNGEEASSVRDMAFGDGIGLLMESAASSGGLAERALRLALANATPLVLALGHADHRADGEFSWTKDTVKYAKHAQLLPCILGLLLDKLSRKKGDYMHTPPFLIGRMLALADTLHREYCVHVRKKDIPPQLLGNALVPAAMDNPQGGFVRLKERLMIYQAWAMKIDGGQNEYRLAKWVLGEMGRVCADLSGFPSIPTGTDDAGKAEMLLGYLARPEKSSGESPLPEVSENVVVSN